MAVTRTEEDKTPSSDEPKQIKRSTVSLLVEELRNRLNNWDTDHMAQVIHEGARGYATKEAKSRKATQ